MQLAPDSFIVYTASSSPLTLRSNQRASFYEESWQHFIAIARKTPGGTDPFQACVLGLQSGWKDFGFLIVVQDGSTRAEVILEVKQKMEQISDGVIPNLRERR
jgi:hypothetical protein